MNILPVVLAALLATSGAVKVRASTRAHLGVHLPSLLEIVGGVGLGAMGALGVVEGRAGMLLLTGGTAALLASSVHLGLRLAAQRRLRARTEGRRLENYVKYLSGSEDHASHRQERGDA